MEAAAGKAFGHHHSHESELIAVGLTSAQLDVVDLTPRIGSEIRTGLDTLLSGSEAQHIRAILEQRGVVYFRGLDITDEQQVAIAGTLGDIPANEGESGIYKISLDPTLNETADYLHATVHWHVDGAQDMLPTRASLLTARVLSEVGGQTEFANTYAAYDDLPDDRKAEADRLSEPACLEESIGHHCHECVAMQAHP